MPSCPPSLRPCSSCLQRLGFEWKSALNSIPGKISNISTHRSLRLITTLPIYNVLQTSCHLSLSARLASSSSNLADDKEINTVTSVIHLSACLQGETYTTVGERITRRSMSCPLANEILTVHARHHNLTTTPPAAGSKFDSLPPGGANQTYRVSLSNNGQHFGSSQTYTLYNNTCIDCGSSGLVQVVSILGRYFHAIV